MLGAANRSGLLATQAIRGGANRDVLARIKDVGSIFFAYADRPWVLDGAAVRIAFVGFDGGIETRALLDGLPVEGINADLSSVHDASAARSLATNAGICFMGPSAKGPFDIGKEDALRFLSAVNPHGRPNSDVVRPVRSGIDLVRGNRDLWTIDFGSRVEAEAALYEAPFERLRQVAKPVRTKNRRPSYASKWWQYAEPRPGLREALKNISRFLATPEVAKHRIFVWLGSNVLANQQILSFARDDDYFFGVLQSHAHEVWALQQGTQLESRPRYTPTTCFETFPLPWAPGKEPADDPRYAAIAEAALELNELRENWLNPPANADGSPALSEEELKKRTLTNLYNERPTWLANAHEKLDRAVFAAYGWEYPLEDQEILSRLLAENLRRAALP